MFPTSSARQRGRGVASSHSATDRGRMPGPRQSSSQRDQEPAPPPASSSYERERAPEDGRAAPPGIVIWDLENCAIPARFNDQLPALVKALRSSYRASRVVTAAEIPATNTAKTDQLRTLSYCDVEVLTFLRPDSNSSAKKHSSADYMLKRVSGSLTKHCTALGSKLLVSSIRNSSDLQQCNLVTVTPVWYS